MVGGEREAAAVGGLAPGVEVVGERLQERDGALGTVALAGGQQDRALPDLPPGDGDALALRARARVGEQRDERRVALAATLKQSGADCLGVLRG